MMRQMRDNMKVIMLVTAGGFVALMVFGWGMDITGRSSAAATGGELGRVNGEPITYEEWNLVYRNLYEQQQRQNPGQPVRLLGALLAAARGRLRRRRSRAPTPCRLPWCARSSAPMAPPYRR